MISGLKKVFHLGWSLGLFSLEEGMVRDLIKIRILSMCINNLKGRKKWRQNFAIFCINYVSVSSLVASMMFQYFVKVVPTVYMKVDGEVSTFIPVALAFHKNHKPTCYSSVFSCYIYTHLNRRWGYTLIAVSVVVIPVSHSACTIGIRNEAASAQFFFTACSTG